MKILRHRLYHNDNEPVTFQASPNYRGDIHSHDYIVMHYTAGTSASSSISWLTNRRAQASAHIVIARDGSVTQLVPFNKCAWHAGRSVWKNRQGLNQYSIGIELDNAGKLAQQGGAWKSWSGHDIEDSDVIIATHKHASSADGWHVYSQAQIESALQVAEVLVDRYPIKNVIGHDDIAPRRKSDPGPAFPMNSFSSHIMGRHIDTGEENIMNVTTNLNIRKGPGTEYEKLTRKSLPQGTKVLVYHHSGNWRFVRVLDEIEGDNDIEGWVHGAYLDD